MYTLKKSLGQHFLHDENIANKIVHQLSFTEGMNLLEIGPGGGALTKYLLQIENIHYKAIEIDEEKVQYLQKHYPAINGKITQIDFLKANKPFEHSFSVIGNFPYNISTQIMFKLLDWEEDVKEVVGMFQKEVAQRIAAKHGNKIYGILSVLIQAYFKVEYLFDVNENCFTPPPKVTSGVIRLTNLNNPFNIQDKAKFIKLIKAGFGHRRKTLRNALKQIWGESIPPVEIFNKRAEQLAVQDWIELYKQYFNDKRQGINIG